MIDWNQIAELRAAVGDEDFKEIATAFLEETDRAVLQLRQSQPGEATADLLHFLKGSALNLGFSGFASLCAEGEQACREGRPVTEDQIMECYRASRALLVQHLGAPEMLEAHTSL